MNTLYPDIKTKNWQISTVGVGYIAEGLADIRQCLDILLRTQKGTDPLRPEFGCDIYQFVDKPLTVAIPAIKRAMIEAVEIWETRVTLRSIRHEIVIENPGQVKFLVTCRLVNEELIDLILLYYGGGFINSDPVDTGSLTLYALFPPNPDGRRYNISFTGNGSSILPAPPGYGFTSIPALFAWVNSNWNTYGTWQLGVDRITLFVRQGLLQTGSLTLSLVPGLILMQPLPLLSVGQEYALTFNPNGSPTPDTPPNFTSAGAMKTWLNANWSIYGTWDVIPNYFGAGDFDINDFDAEDFDTGSTATYLLVLYSLTLTSGTIEINAV